MRLPGPIGEPRRTRRIPPLAISIAALLVIGGGTVWALERSADESASVPSPAGTEAPNSSPAQTPGSQAASSSPGVDTVDDAALLTTARLVDTRPGRTTIDGEFAGTGPLTAGRSLEVAVTGRVDGAVETSLASLTVTASAADAGGELVVASCGSTSPAAVSLIVGSHSTASANLVVPLSADGLICVTSTAPVEVVIDLEAFLDQRSVRPFPAPVRIVDSTPTGSTADGRFETIGVRPERSTLRIPVSTRYSGLTDVGALMVSVSIVDPLADGAASVFAAESPAPASPLITYVAGEASRSTAIVPIGDSGDLCVSTSGPTDLVVELLALVPASASPILDSPGAGGCPGQTMFPDRRVVALYGTQRSDRLGALGEQNPEASAVRLAEVAEPWRAGDRPVLPAFELIATLATGTPEERGDYNIRADPAFVQEYLDVARRHGYYLILDLQPGQSDFLTEAKYYEAFLRQPDVGLALDPEWRTEAPARPRGGDIGQVDASEVNAVIDYLAQLVAEHHLPEKLLVVHQFHERMITNRDQLREQPGVAVTIHMDGFGDRSDKLLSYDMVRAAPPFNMGLKLFYDEDTELLGATEVLGGLFDPVPDMITYQ
jgi:hypothetical protein